jgi:uncharacterized protein (TIGR00369 family)
MDSSSAAPVPAAATATAAVSAGAATPASLAAVDLTLLNAALAKLFAPWVGGLQLRVLQAQAGEVHLELPVHAHLVHGGGVLCGQALMAAADTAMVLAVMSQLGRFKPMSTVQLQTSFLRPIAADSGSARVVARVLRLGRRLVFGEIEAFDAQGQLAAHATTTYALLDSSPQHP